MIVVTYLRHSVGELLVVRVLDLQPVVPRIGETLHAHLPLEVVQLPPGDDSHVHVRKLGQPLQHSFRLRGDYGKLGSLGGGG